MKSLYFRFAIGAFIVAIVSLVLPNLLLYWAVGFGPPRAVRLIGQQSVALELTERLEGVTSEALPLLIDSLEQSLDVQLLVRPLPPRFQGMVDSTAPPYPFSRLGFNRRLPLRPDTIQDRLGIFEPDLPPPPRDEIGIIVPSAGAVIRIGPMLRAPRPLQQLLFYHLLTVLALVTIIAFFVVVPIARRLKKLEAAAVEFGSGNLTARAAISSNDAVGQVAKRFDAMAERIESLIGRERSLLQSVSHELRTPIARIRFSLEMLSQTTDQTEQRRRAEQIDEELTEIDLLVGELLDFNRLQSDTLQLQQESISPLEVINEVIRRSSEMNPSIAISVAGDRSAVIQADRLLFRRAMTNLIGNALRHATSQVTVSITSARTAVSVTVADNGPGIPAEERLNVLQPFYRLEQSDTQAQNAHGRPPKKGAGSGLGLAIVSRIVALHGGSIAVGDAELGGAAITTTWPVSTS